MEVEWTGLIISLVPGRDRTTQGREPGAAPADPRHAEDHRAHEPGTSFPCLVHKLPFLGLPLPSHRPSHGLPLLFSGARRGRGCVSGLVAAPPAAARPAAYRRLRTRRIVRLYMDVHYGIIDIDPPQLSSQLHSYGMHESFLFRRRARKLPLPPAKCPRSWI